MPEGHSVHRIARQFALHFVGHPVAVSSPQGRFAGGAERIDGREMIVSRAVGKQLFLEFDNELWLRVHLGMYGAWDFAGAVELGAARSEPGFATADGPRRYLDQTAAEDSNWSIGAPRRTRLRMAESEKELDADFGAFPPEPVGAVRVRLLTDATVADLRGPTACEVLTPEEVRAQLARLGPDPLVDDPAEGEERFVAAVRKTATPIGLLLMDQSVISGIGNVYRAELLFRARLDPHTPGRSVPEEVVRGLWRDWTHLLTVGVELGVMLTMDDVTPEQQAAAIAHRDDRHWVYHRAGLPCRVCGSPVVMEPAAGRKLYWCPTDQVRP
ncbi:DNA-formamidopyrimidine glycosylase family protein [Galbitalea sp. SE-J8]|uniref:Fpg/Nei family DNA glycosylase n=1 Tax=Galbitalea sp. SE-J8 TaxID=3054952 RepID=UPI00259D096D|nr:DNA-formamidopyrimidine glycosylase family protein [Galbitalea sp. SE-J8]MDM4764085.1 DNA-formamidopyrimidine glycosylase family protein [Galbitalea sp. SE-J8]